LYFDECLRITESGYCLQQVQYNINGWLDKNKDPIQECVIQLMQESKEPLVATFFREPEEGLRLVSNIVITSYPLQGRCQKFVVWWYKISSVTILMFFVTL